MENFNLIKRLMRSSSEQGRAVLDLSANTLGESTLVTVKGKDLRVERVSIIREEVFVEGYFEKGSLRSVRLDSVDKDSLPELVWSVEAAVKSN